MPAPSWWTEDRTEKLKSLYASGIFSCSGIAAEMGGGITRNAVIGKMHRLGLNGQIYIKRRCAKKTPEEKEETKRLKEERRRERRRSQRGNFVMVRVRPTNLEALRCIEVQPLHKSLLDLEPNDCRYPYGDGPFTFCGNPKMEGHSYCGPHFGLAARRGSE